MNLIIVHNNITKLLPCFETILALHILKLLIVAEFQVQALRLHPVWPVYFPYFSGVFFVPYELFHEHFHLASLGQSIFINYWTCKSIIRHMLLVRSHVRDIFLTLCHAGLWWSPALRMHSISFPHHFLHPGVFFPNWHMREAASTIKSSDFELKLIHFFIDFIA